MGKNYLQLSKNRLNQKGIALVLTVGIMLIVSILVMAILMLKMSELQAFKSTLDVVKASHIADAGIENMIWYLRVYKAPVWEWGDPAWGAGLADLSGDDTPAWNTASNKCFGTRINTEYRNNIVSGQERLVTPEIIVTVANPTLTFQHIFDGDNAAVTPDSRLVEQSNDGGITWSTIIAAATGDVATWTLVSQLLTAPVGSRIRIAFSIFSNANLTAPGWYIDEVRVGTVFYDTFEFGIGQWTHIIRPAPSSPIIFPSAADFLPGDCMHYDSFDPSLATEDTWILRSAGVVGSYRSRSEAQVTVHGEKEPYDIDTHYWKRGL